MWRRTTGAPGSISSARALASALNARDVAALRACFVDGELALRFGDRHGHEADDLLGFVPAGNELAFEAAVPAGWTTAARFRTTGPEPAHGLVIFEHEVGGRRLRSARFFTRCCCAPSG
jgi:hypothetical protein